MKYGIKDSNYTQPNFETLHSYNVVPSNCHIKNESGWDDTFLKENLQQFWNNFDHDNKQ